MGTNRVVVSEMCCLKYNDGSFADSYNRSGEINQTAGIPFDESQWDHINESSRETQ